MRMNFVRFPLKMLLAYSNSYPVMNMESNIQVIESSYYAH